MSQQAYQTLARIVGILGPWAAVALIGLILAAFLLFLFLCLRYGDGAFREMLPYCRELISVLKYEPRKSHPAIRLELRLHYFFGGLALISLFAIVLHALIPWVSSGTERDLQLTLIASVGTCICLAAVSIYIALRLP